MMPKQGYDSIIADNMALLHKESCSAAERRLVQLKELAMKAVRSMSVIFGENKADEFAALFDGTTDITDAPEEVYPYLTTQKTVLDFTDRLTVCSFIADELETRGISLIDKLLSPQPHIGPARIAYFRNAYADAAFRIFSEVLDNPSVVYASDFTAVCEEVYYGRADMCMLPLDSSKDAKLISFYRLIDKYELSPIYSCDVTTPDGSVTTRYGLFKKSLSLPERSKLDEGDSCFFEFTLESDGGAALCDVLSAARSCGMSLYKVDSIPLTYKSGEFSCDIIMKIGSFRGLNTFILFLTLSVPQYEPLGIYPHICTEE